VTVTTPGAGCSITSAATVSTTGATGCFTFRATFFEGAGLGLAFAVVGFVAFAAFDGLRTLPRAVAVFLCCAFDCFLRLAMIDPLGLIRAPQRCPIIKSRQPIKRVINRSQLKRALTGYILPESDWGLEGSPPPVRQALLLPCVHWGCTARMGDEGKAVGCVQPTALLSLSAPRQRCARAGSNQHIVAARHYSDAALKKLRTNTSNDGASNDDGNRGDRRSSDGDGSSHSDDGDSNHSDDGSNDDDSRTKLRLEPHCRLRLRQLRPMLQRSSLRFA